MRKLHLAHERAASERVELRCGDGIGRTGTALSASCVFEGMHPEEAVQWVRQNCHPRAVEVPWRRRFIRQVVTADASGSPQTWQPATSARTPASGGRERTRCPWRLAAGGSRCTEVNGALGRLGRTEEAEAEARRTRRTEQGRRWFQHNLIGARTIAAATKAADAARERTAGADVLRGSLPLLSDPTPRLFSRVDQGVGQCG
ncbi:hypothetical protein [Streptomyces sp. NPDC003247]|uniref:protein-tyrosine phosphatase family protein n=1 Tax=Streptomyces sp. NPDC003247 TaxID=3364677 RepID=UPI0036AD32D0